MVRFLSSSAPVLVYERIASPKSFKDVEDITVSRSIMQSMLPSALLKRMLEILVSL